MSARRRTGIMDAAHIEPWAETGNDDLANGLALSKSAHWMFDAGLWTVDDDLRVAVNASRFIEAGPEALQLRAAAGRHLQFAPQARLRPSVECLRRHRLRFALNEKSTTTAPISPLLPS